MWRVMIVDDDYIARHGMRDMLRWQDMRCEVAALAEDGADALRQIPSARPDIVFTDVVMPRMDGLELLRRTGRAYPAIKVVVVSAYDESASIREALRHEAVDYLLKPFDEQDVFQALTRAKMRMAREGAAPREDGDEARLAYVLDAVTEGDAALAAQRAEQLIAARDMSFLSACSLCADLLLRACALAPQGEGLMEGALSGLFAAGDEARLCRHMRETLEGIAALSQPAGGNARIARAAVKMLKTQFQENITVLQMAEALNVSENHLQAIFKREVGMTIRQFLTDVRVQRAATLLITTDRKIFAIATDVGYRDVDHFTRVFREKMGVTPNAYRER